MAAAWPEGDAFQEELNRLNKPSSSKINSLADQALSLHRHYKNVVHALEKYVRKSTKDTRLLGLYVIDSLLRKSRAKFGEGPKDVFAARLSANMLLTFAKLIEVRRSDLDRVKRILDSWKAKSMFSDELLEEMEAIYQSAAEAGGIDEDEEEEKGGGSPVPPTGEESPDRSRSPARKPPPPMQQQQPPQQSHPPPPQSHAQSASNLRDPRRAAAQPAASAATSFPPPPPPPASGGALAALANLQSRLTSPSSTVAASQSFQGSWPAAAAPAPAPVAAPAPMSYPVPPPPPPPAAAAEDAWDYDDEEDEEEDEEARKEKLRVRLDQEKARMEAANAAPPPPPPAAAPGGYPAPSLGAPAGSPAAAAPRRSRFSAPKSKEEVDAELAAAAGGFPAASPALAHAGSSGLNGSYDRSRSHGGPPDDRRRSRSRSRERDHPNARSDRGGTGNAPGAGGGGGRPGNTGAQNPGFVRLPESEQSGSTWVKVLSTTLRVNHEKLATLGMNQNSMREQLRSIFQQFGTVDWLNVTDTTSYVRFRTRRSAALAKAGSDGLTVGASVSAAARLSWAKAKEMDKDYGWRQDSGEGSVEAANPVLERTPVEEPDQSIDEGWMARKGGLVPGPQSQSQQQQQQQQSSQQSSQLQHSQQYAQASGYPAPALASSGYAAAPQSQQQQQQAYMQMQMQGAGQFMQMQPNQSAYMQQQPMAGGYAQQPFSPTGAGLSPYGQLQQQPTGNYPQAQSSATPSGGAYVHPSRGQLPWMQQQQR